MPSNLADDVELKFGLECAPCKFVKRPRTCRGCDAGEMFEESDPEGVDALIRN